MEQNICRFIPKSEDQKSINILNFVYESEHRENNALRLERVYKLHLVLKGSGILHVLGESFVLEEGDIFFLFPSEHYSIEAIEAFEYMYISYIGLRANQLMDMLKITKKNFLFKNMYELIPLWKVSILDDKSILNLRCEAILLYTFSVLGSSILQSKAERVNEEIIFSVKKYIDENFSEGSLSLQEISSRYSYNAKYMSGLFKKSFNIGISHYIQTLRIQKACTLMEQGFTSVKDISYQCGFSDQFYFSRIFKAKTGKSPTVYIKELNN